MFGGLGKFLMDKKSFYKKLAIHSNSVLNFCSTNLSKKLVAKRFSSPHSYFANFFENKFVIIKLIFNI